MASQKNILRFKEFGSKKREAAAAGLRGLRQVAGGLPASNHGGAVKNPQHLIGMLFAHGSRARRTSLPRTDIQLSVFTPGGKSAIKIRV